MPSPLSAVDCISPAFGDTRRMLFAPWRFRMWARMGVLGLLTGEFATGGWGGSSNIQLPRRTGHYFTALRAASLAFPPWLKVNWGWIALLAALGALLVLVYSYVAAVSRFILFDSVVRGRCELRQGWRKWRREAVRFFLWDIGFSFVCLTALTALVGVPLLLAFRAGWFHHGEEKTGALVLGGLALFFVVLGALILAAVVDLFARDFLVPVMALEGRGVFDGWRRVLPILAREKLASAGYVLMKVVLAVGSAILFGIVNLLALFLLLIPLGIIGAAIYFAARAMSLAWNFAAISGVAVLSALALAAVLWLIAVLYSPGLVFFQSYALRFLGSRYPLLAQAMAPAPPETVPPPAPPSASLPAF